MLRLLFGRRLSFFDVFVIGFALGYHDLLASIGVLMVGMMLSAAGETALDRHPTTP